MLYLNPPYYIINGVTVLPDHADPMQYYFMPMAPHLSTVKDEATGADVPKLLLIKYRGDAGTGGFLNFDVNLGVSQERLDEVRAELRDLMDLDDLPRLAPIPLTDGTVTLNLLARKSDAPAPVEGEEPDASIFEIDISHSAKPALYGENQASFSVELNDNAVKVIDQAFDGEIVPMNVVYSLSYWALRPAYAVKLVIDWESVQSHFSESFGFDSLIFSSQIDEVIDDLMEKRIIDLQADLFIPEGEDPEAVVERFDYALNEARDMITDTFFEPSASLLNIASGDSSTLDDISDTADRISQLAVSGGASALTPTFSYKKVDLTRTDKKSLNVNFNERTTVERRIYPQGHLQGLFQVTNQPGIDRSRFVREVNLNDPWFESREIEVISRANMEEDAIVSINAELRYEGEVKNVLLEASDEKETVKWNSTLDAHRAMKRPVEVGYSIMFKGADSSERPIRLQSPKVINEIDTWEINPRELYSLVSVPVVALDFPFKQYSNIEIELRYEDAENGLKIDDNLMLDESNSEAMWKLFSLDPSRNVFSYKITYRAVDHKDIEGAWVETDEERITIRDPFPNKRTLQVIPNVDWDLVSQIFVDLLYKDTANGVNEEESLSFNRSTSNAQTFSVDLVDKERRQIEYKVTLLFENGSMREIPASVTQDKRVIIRDDMKAHRIVSIQLAEGLDLAAQRLSKLELDVRYVSLEGSVDVADSFVFTQGSGEVFFEFDIATDASDQYEYKLTKRFTNGMRTVDGWVKASDSVLLINVQ